MNNSSGSSKASSSAHHAGARGGGPSSAAGSGPKGMSHKSQRERYQDVEAFWKSTSVEQRRELLRVPLSSLLHSVRADHGPEVTEEVCEGLVLLKEQGNGAAR